MLTVTCLSDSICTCIRFDTAPPMPVAKPDSMLERVLGERHGNGLPSSLDTPDSPIDRGES